MGDVKAYLRSLIVFCGRALALSGSSSYDTKNAVLLEEMICGRLRD